ncbi:MAG: glycosyltransferase [Cyclobacteriaceae bacterium]
MNVFIIPSWYPSASNPIYGTFNYEQARLLSKTRENWSIGVSTWGQGDIRFLLGAFDPRSILRAMKRYESDENAINKNLKEYFSPAFTWSRKVASGNISGIIKANEDNLNRFIGDFGKPDILSAQASYPAALIAAHLANKHRIPYTVTIRMSPFPFSEFREKNGKLKALIDEPLRNADQLIATSHSLKENLLSNDFEKVEVVNNPVDLSFFRPDQETKNSNHLLVVGRIEEQKGIDLLIHAIVHLGDSFEGKVRIAGDGSLIDNYRKMARDAGVESKIEWLGQLSRNQVLEEMRRCSFYVLSSRHETFGNVVVEAMACGKPVVATKCGGPEEIVSETSGLLCEINSTDLAAKIRLMIEMRADFKDEDIRAEAERRFSSEKWANRLEAVFKTVISR